MKKTVTVLAIALSIGVIGYQIADAGPGRGWGPGGCNGPYNNTETSEKWQAFQNETADLRQQLFDKRHDYFTMMNSEEVDKEAAQALWSEMFDLKSQIREKAAAAGVDPREGYGRRPGRGSYACNGPRGGGYFCDGPYDGGADDAPCNGPGSCWNR